MPRKSVSRKSVRRKTYGTADADDDDDDCDTSLYTPFNMLDVCPSSAFVKRVSSVLQPNIHVLSRADRVDRDNWNEFINQNYLSTHYPVVMLSKQSSVYAFLPKANGPAARLIRLCDYRAFTLPVSHNYMYFIGTMKREHLHAQKHVRVPNLTKSLEY